jgi:hypothetical protein
MTDSTRSTSLDEVIATVARQMTAASPSAELHARIIASLPVSTPRGGWWRGPVPALASAAVVVIAIGLAWKRPSPLPPHAIEATKIASLAATSISESASTSLVSAVTSASSTPQTAAREEPPQLSAAEQEWQARAIPSLSVPNALEIQALTTTTQTISEIRFDAIGPAPLVIPALRTSGGQ